MTARAHALASRWLKALRPLTATNINQVARRLEPTLKRRFLLAVKRMKGRVDLEVLVESLRVRDAVRGMSAVHPETWSQTLEPTASVVPQAFRQAGQVAASLLTSQAGITITFDLTNPRAVQWARTQSSRLITDVSVSTKDAVSEIIGRSFTEGIPPRESARLIRNVVGLHDRQAMAVINYRFELLEAGRSADDVARLAARYSQQLLNQRALMIARTETIASSTNGQQELWRQAVDRQLLDPALTRREWIVTPDERKPRRLCDLCALMDGKTTTLEEPFEGGVMLPPLHVACRCAIGLRFVNPS